MSWRGAHSHPHRKRQDYGLWWTTPKWNVQFLLHQSASFTFKGRKKQKKETFFFLFFQRVTASYLENGRKKKTWTCNIEGWKNYRGQRSRWSELRGNLKNKKKERKKKKANINPGLYFLFFRHHESVNTHLLSFVLLFTFFLFFFSSFFFFFSRCILGAMWVWSPEKLMREGCILYYHIILGRSQLLFYSSLFYFFSYLHHQYLLIRLKMDVKT